MTVRAQPIPFVGRSDEERWIVALNAAFGMARIRPVAQLSEAERTAAEVAVVTNPEPADLMLLPNLRWIQSLWAGVEKLIDPANGLDVPVVRMMDPEMARTMAESVQTWAWWLHLDGPAYQKQQRERTWAPRERLSKYNRRVSVLGLGHLGSAAALRLAADGFDVAGWSRTIKDIEGVVTFTGDEGLTGILARSDILVVLLPSTPQTAGLLDRSRLMSLPKDAMLINFARGRIVDETGLLEVLDKGHLSHAVLDVFTTEPLPADHPFWRHEAVTVLPHVSAPTNMATASRIVRDNILAFEADGTIPPTVDRGQGY